MRLSQSNFCNVYFSMSLISVIFITEKNSKDLEWNYNFDMMWCSYLRSQENKIWMYRDEYIVKFTVWLVFIYKRLKISTLSGWWKTSRSMVCISKDSLCIWQRGEKTVCFCPVSSEFICQWIYGLEGLPRGRRVKTSREEIWEKHVWFTFCKWMNMLISFIWTDF